LKSAIPQLVRRSLWPREMPARLTKLAGWLERRGVVIDRPNTGSHWKARFPDGSVFPLPAHNALRTEISDVYLNKLAKRFGMTRDQLLREL
jgi:hypothetical protein